MPSPQANDTPWWFHPGSYMLLGFTPKRNHSIMAQCSVRGILAFRRGNLKKKASDLEQVNHTVLQVLDPAHIEVEICRSEELDHRRGLTSELDEMWSYVRSKANPRWLWHAIDHHSGHVLAYVFGRRQDTVFLQLQALLEPFGITRYYTDGWGAYERHIDTAKHRVGKENTQKIESKHINLRTRIKRLVRRTICFSKTEHMHDLVIGLFINRPRSRRRPPGRRLGSPVVFQTWI